MNKKKARLDRCSKHGGGEPDHGYMHNFIYVDTVTQFSNAFTFGYMTRPYFHAGVLSHAVQVLSAKRMLILQVTMPSSSAKS